jgi:hypothetical protein
MLDEPELRAAMRGHAALQRETGGPARPVTGPSKELFSLTLVCYAAVIKAVGDYDG